MSVFGRFLLYGKRDVRHLYFGPIFLPNCLIPARDAKNCPAGNICLPKIGPMGCLAICNKVCDAETEILCEERNSDTLCQTGSSCHPKTLPSGCDNYCPVSCAQGFQACPVVNQNGCITDEVCLPPGNCGGVSPYSLIGPGLGCATVTDPPCASDNLVNTTYFRMTMTQITIGLGRNYGTASSTV